MHGWKQKPLLRTVILYVPGLRVIVPLLVAIYLESVLGELKSVYISPLNVWCVIRGSQA